MTPEPETYRLKPTSYCPNSSYPVLVYRDVMPAPHSETATTAFLERHAWAYGGTWGHIAVRHFHPNTHECYGIFQGESTMLVGAAKEDNPGPGVGEEIHLRAGDVIVLPAGTGHCNTQSSEDYKYVGVYPTNGPKWRFELGQEPGDGERFRGEIDAVAFPGADPVTGLKEGLMRLWSKVAS